MGLVRCTKVCALAVAAATSLGGVATSSAATPPVGHIFTIVLENESADTSFGPHSPAPYLARTMPAAGAMVPNYYGTGHASLDNYISMISGQAANPTTQADCQQYVDFLPGTPGPDGQSVGQGCVFPADVQTVANQLEEKGRTWHGYMEDMGADPAREPATCGHPPINSHDPTQVASAKDQYAARHDPFVYFHSIIDLPTCQRNVVPLTRLQADLGSAAATPNYVFVTPDLCHDGHDATCADGGPGGLAAANGFLRTWVPRIVASPAFRTDGLLIVLFDESVGSDSAACCGEQPGPNSPQPGISGPGGGRTGAVLISRYIRGGTLTHESYNHYSMLRSVEDLFGLSHLGYADQPDLLPLGSDVFTAPAGDAQPAKHLPCSLPRTGGPIVYAASIIRVQSRRNLTLELRQRAKVKFVARRSGKKPSSKSRKLAACRLYSFRLPSGTTSVKVTARAGKRHEKRTLKPS